MDKANQALRRSSVKLKCLNSGHSDLNMVISDVGKMRSAFKSFHLAQAVTWEDIAKWASKEKNIALQEVCHVLLDLCYMWSEVQLEFIAGLKKFRQQFERILESETLLDKSKAYLSTCEQKDQKIRKELKKATSKGNVTDAKHLIERQMEAQALVKVAQTEVNSKALENEAVKLMLVKEGLFNVSLCYMDMVGKARIIFNAHKEVSKCLPDVHNKDIEEIRYSGSEVTRNIILTTKEAIHCYKKSSDIESAPPPPYSISPPASPLQYNASSNHAYINSTNNCPTYSNTHHENIGPSEELQYVHYDLPPLADSAECLEGAVGGLNISDDQIRRYSNI